MEKTTEVCFKVNTTVFENCTMKWNFWTISVRKSTICMVNGSW